MHLSRTCIPKWSAIMRSIPLLSTNSHWKFAATYLLSASPQKYRAYCSDKLSTSNRELYAWRPLGKIRRIVKIKIYCYEIHLERLHKLWIGNHTHQIVFRVGGQGPGSGHAR